MNEKEKNSFIDFVKSALSQETLDLSGTMLYSSFNTLKKGKYMILGLNPGGDPHIIKETIIEKLKNTKLDDKSEYLKEWEKDKKHRLQENLKSIAEKLDFDLNDVFSTNLFFSRTKGEETLHKDELEESLIVHEEFLKRVNPETIIIFGVIPFYKYKIFLRNNLNYAVTDEGDCESGHGKWRIRFFTAIGINKIKVIGLPHLSVYTIYTRPEKLEWLKNEVNNHKP